MEKENNGHEQEKLEQLRNEISELEKALQKKKEIEELEKKKLELEAELNNETGNSKLKDTSSDKGNTASETVKKPENRIESEKEDEVEYYSYDEVVKKERNKWIFIGIAAVLITLGISTLYVNGEKKKNEELLKTQIEQAQKEVKDKTEAELKAQMEKKLAEETQKIRAQAEEEAKRNAALESIAQNTEISKKSEDNKTESGIGIEIPKIDSKQIDELNKKAKETQKNIEDFIEKKDGIIGFYNEATAKFNAFVKNIENFFNSFIGNSESKDEKNEENKK